MHNRTAHTSQITPAAIKKEDGRTIHLVCARELHMHLGVRTKFDSWIELQIARWRLRRSQDYVVIEQRPGGKARLVVPSGYFLTLEVAAAVAHNSRKPNAYEVFGFLVVFARTSSSRLRSDDLVGTDVWFQLFPRHVKDRGLQEAFERCRNQRTRRPSGRERRIGGSRRSG